VAGFETQWRRAGGPMSGMTTRVCRLPTLTQRFTQPETNTATESMPTGDVVKANLLTFDHNDAGNAQRLVALHGRDLRYCHAMKKWLVWDGRRWMVDETGLARKRAKATMAEFIRQAVDQSDKNNAAKTYAINSLNENRITAMLASAECEIPITPAELDTHPYLLNCKKGTLDLKTGELQAHQREDFITKLVHLDYNPNARCDLFLRSINRMMGDGPDASDGERERADRLVEYLQKAFGYSLSGDVAEKAVFCFFGSGNNGKTTLLEIIRYVISEYATQVLIDSLMVRAHGETNNSMADLADLRGCRFVTTSEAEEGQRLAEGKLKYLSAGMGKVKTCRKYENHIEFLATHKLFLDANHKPIIRGTDKAIWNRIKTIPFTVTIPPDEMDKGLLVKLKAEAEGILAWMVEGFLRWMKEGLGDPPEVTEAGATWRDEMDPLRDFLADSCDLHPDAFCQVTELRQAYERWAEANGEKYPLQRTKFIERLEQLGCTRVQHRFEKGSPERGWRGISLKTCSSEGV
jgi:putative DNA primase/helicase